MEAVGLAVGVAGLFTAVMDMVDKVYTYKSFQLDSDTLAAQFDAERVKFKHWGSVVGLADGRLSASHTEIWGPERETAVRNLLEILHKMLEMDTPSIRKMTKTLDGLDDGGARGSSHAPTSHMLPSGSIMMRKLKWSVRGKAEREAQVETFRVIVQQLHDLMPLDAAKAVSSGTHGTHSDIPKLDEILQILSRNEAQYKVGKRREARAWIEGQEAPNERYNESLQRKLPGTCDWILSHPGFLNWLSAGNSLDSRVLWINGHAGFGKTVLCARIVEHLSATSGTTVAHFFFSSSFSTHDPFTVARSWVAQLMSSNTDAADLVCEEQDDKQVADRETVLTLLKNILLVIPKCILIIDGFDECTPPPESHHLISRFVHDVKEALHDTARLLIVSRDEVQIRDAVMSKGLCEIKITAVDVNSDVAAVSRDIVDKQLPKKSAEIKTSLAESMAERCDGQFLWLTMQAASLRKGMTKKELHLAIEDTSAGLEHTYDRYWNKVLGLRPRDRDRAFSVLRWATFSLRPLTAGEIMEAVLIDEDSDDFPVDDVADDVQDFVETEIIGLCSPLLEVNTQPQSRPSEMAQSTQIAQLAHFSVKQYLTGRLPTKTLGANEALQMTYDQMQNTMLANMCLRYVRSQVWGTVASQESSPFKALFLDYAASSWHRHINSSSGDASTLPDLAIDFMDERHASWAQWRAWYDTNEGHGTFQRRFSKESQPQDPLYYALRCDLLPVAMRLIHDKSKDRRWSNTTALFLACQLDCLPVVEALINAGVDLSSRYDGRTILAEATFYGCEDIVRFLLDRGADTAENPGAIQPLMVAAFKNHTIILRLLLDGEADVTATNVKGYTALLFSVSRGGLSAASILIEYGSDVSAATADGYTALMMAAESGNVNLVRLLLDAGADVSTAKKGHVTALMIAIREGVPDMVRLLLDRGAQSQAADDDGKTPLMLGAETGNVEMIRWLLQSGGGINNADKRGYTALLCAVSCNHTDAARFLIEQGADLNATLATGKTTAHFAARKNNLEVLKLLVEHGINLCRADSIGFTTLQEAAYSGSFEALCFMLDNGAEVDERDSEDWTAVLTAVARGHLGIARTLLDRGASVAATTKRAANALTMAIASGSCEIVEFVLEKGLDASEVDQSGLAPLHRAAMSSNPDILRQLLVASPQTSINCADLMGRTPLFYASRFGRENNVRHFLADDHIITTGQDCYGNTPLFAAARNGHHRVVKLLLDTERDVPMVDLYGGFGHPLLWWPQRGVDPDVARVLQEHMNRKRTGLDVLTFPNASSGVGFDEEEGFCDVCTLSCVDGYYNCPICLVGCFSMCARCYELGFKCLESSHELEFIPPKA